MATARKKKKKSTSRKRVSGIAGYQKLVSSNAGLKAAKKALAKAEARVKKSRKKAEVAAKKKMRTRKTKR